MICKDCGNTEKFWLNYSARHAELIDMSGAIPNILRDVVQSNRDDEWICWECTSNNVEKIRENDET